MTSPSSTKVLLITANIASCFEQGEDMCKTWLDQLFERIHESAPQFIALHCQEVGGKNYEASEENVNTFYLQIKKRANSKGFNRLQVFIDIEYNHADKFTALGNLYFVRDGFEEAEIWNFAEQRFVKVFENESYIGNIESVATKEKSKFPQEFFPACKWSRKGFMRTRWNLGGTQMDLVNIHLFHDASNLKAMEKYPSDYTLNRKRAFEHTLDRFHNDSLSNVPIFIFGDFNFRLDTGAVVKELTKNTSVIDVEDNGNRMRKYLDQNGSETLTISKKVFTTLNQSSLFLKDHGKWLRPFDKEISQFSNRIAEFDINFPPSYPFEEGPQSTSGNSYMKTRCPSWCDRILFTKSAKRIIDDSVSQVKYDIIGLGTRMGDHKPVSVCVNIQTNIGPLSCCSPCDPCKNFVHKPSSVCFRITDWCLCESYAIGEDCVCPDDVSEHSKTCDMQLKRARSDPLKFSTLAKVQHSLLVLSHSLGSDGTKLRLKHSSNRLESHHSSSSEEWFEEEPTESPLTTTVPDSEGPPVPDTSHSCCHIS